MVMRFIRGFVIVALLTGIVAVLVGWLISLPKVDLSELTQNSGPTIIYDAEGKTAITVTPSQGDTVALSAIPVAMQHAFIATEDARFYQNQGIDLRGMARAFVYDLTHGGRAEGASTIPEQLAKIVYLHDDKSLSYKLKEIALAAQIERQFSKDQILDMYLNRVYLGPDATGVNQAAQVFFGKSLSDLSKPTPQNIADAALLSAQPRDPAYYDPFAHPQNALARRNLVLSLMQQNGYITAEQESAAAKTPLGIDTHSTNTATDTNPYPWYLDAVLEEADGLNIPGVDAESIMAGGLKVYTNMNQTLQTDLQNVYAQGNLFPDQLVQSAALFTDPQTGGVEALVGGRTHVFRGFNRALDMHRSPGSSIKPIMDYGPAIDIGKFGPNSLLVDKPMTFGNSYQPSDWDNFAYHAPGTETMTEALIESWNIPAVWTLDQIGIQTGLSYAAKDGIVLPASDANLAVAIGGMSTGVSPLQMAQGYEPFANQGIMTPAHIINRITTPDGQVLYQAHSNPVQVFKQTTVSEMTQMLKQAVDKGTGELAAIPGRDVAGKTGTSNFPGTNGDMDSWFVGYTPSLVGAVWLGYDQTDSQHYLKDSGTFHASGIPAHLWSLVVSQALAGTPNQPFAQASQVTTPPSSQPNPGDNKKPASPDGSKPKKGDGGASNQNPDSGTPSISNLSATFDGGSVQLNWTPVSVPNVIYSVFRATGVQNDQSGRIGVSETGSFADSNVQAGTTYYYIVVATYQDGRQVCQSNMATVTIPNDASTSSGNGQSGGSGGSADSSTTPSNSGSDNSSTSNTASSSSSG